MKGVMVWGDRVLWGFRWCRVRVFFLRVMGHGSCLISMAQTYRAKCPKAYAILDPHGLEDLGGFRASGGR